MSEIPAATGPAVPFVRHEAPAAKPVEAPPPAPVAVKARHGNEMMQEIAGFFRYAGLGKERILIIQNLATMLGAGLPLVDAVRTLHMEARYAPIRKLLLRIITNVENGVTLWHAMEQEHFFSPQAIALVRIGEESGKLAENMDRLAIQQEKDQALRSKITMAMIYPGIVLSLMFIIVIGLGLFVLPNLIQVLFSLNVPLPLVTRLLIAFTRLMTKYGAVAVPSMIVGIFILVILGKFTRLKSFFQWIAFGIPGIGSLLRDATIARFGVIVGGLLQAGVSVPDSLKSLADVTTIVSYKKFYLRLLEHVQLGDSFGKCFEKIPKSKTFLPISVQQLIMTGERTGTFSVIALKIADIYEKKANDTAQKLPVILEPLLLLIMGAMVGTIALAIIVPIYSIVGKLGH